MKRLLALSSLLIPVCLFAQGFGSFSHDQPFLAGGSAGLPPGPDSLPELAYWWDFTDAAHTTIVSGKYSQVDNKGYVSNTCNVVQATANNRPIVTTQNGYNVGGFYGTNWLQQQSGNIIFTNSSSATVFMVCQIAVPPSIQLPFCIGDPGSPGLGVMYIAVQSDGTYQTLANDGSNIADDSIGFSTTNAICDYITSVDPGQSSKCVTNFWNTIVGNTRAFDGNLTFLPGNLTKYEIGACESSATPGSLPVTNGKIYEVGVFSRILSPTERATLRTYWRAKYGY